jgi:hypothetical protein
LGRVARPAHRRSGMSGCRAAMSSRRLAQGGGQGL